MVWELWAVHAVMGPEECSNFELLLLCGNPQIGQNVYYTNYS